MFLWAAWQESGQRREEETLRTKSRTLKKRTGVYAKVREGEKERGRRALRKERTPVWL